MRDFKAATYSRLSKRSWGGEGKQIAKVGNKREKTAGTREHKPIFEGNKGTRTPPPGDPHNSNQLSFPLDFLHSNTVILSPIYRTLDYSKPPQTQSNQFSTPMGKINPP